MKIISLLLTGFLLFAGCTQPELGYADYSDESVDVSGNGDYSPPPASAPTNDYDNYDSDSSAQQYQPIPPENLPKLKDYPVILSLDPEKQKVAKEQVLFSAFHDGLAPYFTIYDVQGQIRQELMQSGTSSQTIPEDVLFSKFNQADLCVYLWSQIEETEFRMGGSSLLFFRPTIGCRVVDTLTHEEKIRLVRDDKIGQKGSSIEENRRRAIRILAEKMVDELYQRIHRLVQDEYRKNTYYVRGTLPKKENQKKLRDVLLSLERDGEFKIKSTNLESALFEYVIVAKRKNESQLAQLISDEAQFQNLRVNIRTARHLINISPKKGEFDE